MSSTQSPDHWFVYCSLSLLITDWSGILSVSWSLIGLLSSLSLIGLSSSQFSGLWLVYRPPSLLVSHWFVALSVSWLLMGLSSSQSPGLSLVYRSSLVSDWSIPFAPWMDALQRWATGQSLEEDPEKVCRLVGLLHLHILWWVSNCLPFISVGWPQRTDVSMPVCLLSGTLYSSWRHCSPPASASSYWLSSLASSVFSQAIRKTKSRRWPRVPSLPPEKRIGTDRCSLAAVTSPLVWPYEPQMKKA